MRNALKGVVMGRTDDAQLLPDNGFGDASQDLAAAGSLLELTALAVSQARTRRHQLRALEADTGISKTTWSAWGRGQRAIGRDRLEEVVRRFDPSRLGEWLAAWDRLAAAEIRPEPEPDPDPGPAAEVEVEVEAARDSAPGGPADDTAPAKAGAIIRSRRPRTPVALAATGLIVVVGVVVAAVILLRSEGNAVTGGSPGAAAGALQEAALSVGGPAAGAESVRLLSPEPGAVVEGCLVVVGTGRPDVGQTLLVSVRDWSSPAAVFRFGWVSYDRPESLAAGWTARRPLPWGGESGYEVLVVAVDERVTDLERQLSPGENDGWVSAQLPAAARVVAAVRVHGGDSPTAGHPARCPPS